MWWWAKKKCFDFMSEAREREKKPVSLLVCVYHRRIRLKCKSLQPLHLSVATSCVWFLCFSLPWLVGSSLPSSSIARRCVGWLLATPWLSMYFVGSENVPLCPWDNFGLFSATWCCSSAFWESRGETEEWLDLLLVRTAWTGQGKRTVSHTCFLLKSS